MLSRLKPYLFTFFLILALVSVPQVVAQNDTQPIDVILLLDSSGSTADQRDLIQKATEFLLDYLEANTGFADLDYRLSIIGFNQDVIKSSAIYLGRPTEANLAKFFADTSAGGDTDFKLAIEYALNEFSRVNTPGTARTPIVILMTDGQPARRGQPLPDSELNTYFDDLSQILTTAVNDTGLQFFVVAVGQAAADQARWQNALPREDQYVYIDDNSNLSEVYWQFLSEFMGGEQDAIVELTANKTHTISVEPYLDEISLTVLKDTDDAVIQIVTPRGYLFTDPPIRGSGSEDLHEIYVISTPEKGDWKIALQGSDGRLLITRRYPQVTLEVDRPVLPVNEPLTVQAALNSESLAMLNPETIALRLIDNPSASECDSSGYPFTKLSDGIYEAEIPGFIEADIYTLSLIVCVNKEVLETIPKEEVEVKAVHLPEILSFDVSPSVYGKPFIITYDIAYDEDIGDLRPVLEISLEEEPLETIEIESHDALRANSIEYLPEQEGNYEFALRIQGSTPDRLPFADKQSRARNYVNPEALVTPESEVPTVESTTVAPTPIEVTATPAIVTTSPSFAIPFTLRELGLILVVVPLALVAGYLGFRVYRNFQAGTTTRIQEDEPVVTPPPPNGPSEPRVENRQNGFFKKERVKVGDIRTQIKNGGLELAQAEIELDEVLRNVEEQVQSDVTKPVSQLTRDIFDAFYQFYKEPTDPKEFYDEIVNPRFRQYKKNRSMAWGIIDELERIWQGDPDKALSYLYDSLLPGVKDLELLRVFAQHPENIFKRHTTYLMNALDTFDNAQLKNLAVQATVKPKCDNLAELYTYLATLNTSLPFSVDIESTQKLFQMFTDRQSPATLWEFVRELTPHLKTLTTPNNTLEGWKKAQEDIKNTLIVVRSYQYLPEATLLARRLEIWQEFAFQQAEGFRGSLMVTPGSLAVEVRPSLDIFALPEERLNERGDWDVSIPLTLYHLGDWPITDIETEVRLAQGGRFGSTKLEFLQEGVVHSQLIKMGTVAQSDTSITIQTVFTTNTLSHRGQFGTEQKQADFLYQSNNFTVAPKSQSWPSEMPLILPYISDRPLNEEEFNRLFKGEDRQLVEAIPEYIKSTRLQSRLISLMGLRRTGKTTLLDLSLQQLRDSTDALFMVVKVDLLVWLINLQEEKGGYSNIESDIDFFFWSYLYKEFEQVIHQRVGDVAINQQPELFFEKLDLLLHATREKQSSIRFVVAFDEADFFGHALFRKYFQKEEKFAAIPGRLLDLVVKYDMVMIVVHDNLRVVWQQELVNVYYDKTSAHALSEYRYFRTHPINRRDTNELLKLGPFSFTKLAEEAVWVFTGGYASLVQLLCQRLIEKRNEQWQDEVMPKLHSVTVADVKQVAYQEAYHREEMIKYLTNSFDRNELRLLLLLAQEGFVDPNTGILAIPYGASWQQLGRLNQKSEQMFSDDLDPQKLQHALASLIDKQILARVEISQERTTRLRWRIGWLYVYFKSESFDIMLGKLQPVLARFNSDLVR